MIKSPPASPILINKAKPQDSNNRNQFLLLFTYASIATRILKELSLFHLTLKLRVLLSKNYCLNYGLGSSFQQLVEAEIVRRLNYHTLSLSITSPIPSSCKTNGIFKDSKLTSVTPETGNVILCSLEHYSRQDSNFVFVPEKRNKQKIQLTAEQSNLLLNGISLDLNLCYSFHTKFPPSIDYSSCTIAEENIKEIWSFNQGIDGCCRTPQEFQTQLDSLLNIPLKLKLGKDLFLNTSKTSENSSSDYYCYNDEAIVYYKILKKDSTNIGTSGGHVITPPKSYKRRKLSCKEDVKALCEVIELNETLSKRPSKQREQGNHLSVEILIGCIKVSHSFVFKYSKLRFHPLTFDLLTENIVSNTLYFYGKVYLTESSDTSFEDVDHYSNDKENDEGFSSRPNEVVSVVLSKRRHLMACNWLSYIPIKVDSTTLHAVPVLNCIPRITGVCCSFWLKRLYYFNDFSSSKSLLPDRISTQLFDQLKMLLFSKQMPSDRTIIKELRKLKH